MVRCPNCASKQSPHYCQRLADEVIAWFPQRLAHTKGRWAGQPFQLLDFQIRDVVPIFAWQVWEPEIGRWVRLKRTAYFEWPRKNTKSTTGAGIAIRLLAADGEEGAEIYSVAEDLDQANIIFGMARAMVDASPVLSKRVKAYRRTLEYTTRAGNLNIYRVLPGDAAGAHGLNVHGLIFDELHTQQNRELWDVMTSAQGARTQPLTVAFSTAGTDRTSICREQHDYGEQVKSRIVEDPSFHYVRYGAPEGEEYDWEDEELWKACNPALGAVVPVSFLRAEYRKAKASPGRQNAFRNLYLCEWTSSTVRWMDLARWDDSAGIVPPAEELKGRTCVGGLDASHTQDIASVCWDFGEERVWRFWLPKDRFPDLMERTGGQARKWVDEKVLMLTDGDVTDYGAIKKQVMEDAKLFNVGEIAYNSHAILPLVNDLVDEGFTMVPISQGITKLSPGTKELERLVLEGKYRHGGNPIMRWMIDGTVVRSDSDGNIKPDKEKSRVNITGVVAAVMALDRQIRHVEDTRSRELVTF